VILDHDSKEISITLRPPNPHGLSPLVTRLVESFVLVYEYERAFCVEVDEGKTIHSQRGEFI
jgi:hypothetical protein